MRNETRRKREDCLRRIGAAIGFGFVQTDASGNNTAYIEPVQLEAVRTGLDVDNRIELLLIDGLLSIRINDIDVGSVNIGTSPRGNVGMMVICGEQSAEVIFDDFELREIAQ